MDVPEIDVDELERRLASSPFVLDVREHDEWTATRISGVVHIPLADVPARIEEIPRNATVLVVCARGGRSRMAAEFLRLQGIDAVNVDGGTLGWFEAGKPVEQGPQA